jgi:hypothetical protein
MEWGMNRVERKQLHVIAEHMDAIAKALLLGEIENDTASHWITILALRIRMNRMARADLYAWYLEEYLALKAFIKSKGLHT